MNIKIKPFKLVLQRMCHVLALGMHYFSIFQTKLDLIYVGDNADYIKKVTSQHNVINYILNVRSTPLLIYILFPTHIADVFCICTLGLGYFLYGELDPGHPFDLSA